MARFHAMEASSEDRDDAGQEDIQLAASFCELQHKGLGLQSEAQVVGNQIVTK